MPTPVKTARQCLAGEAAAALDGAVAVARLRAHAQTTSLHVVSALLSLPSSSPSLLRDALSRTRSTVYPSRLQSRALDLCFSAALDRLPCAPSGSPHTQVEPPVSNSLMAAIKRSQANQRRNPDPLNVYSQQQGFPSSGPMVELQQLVLSMLDDPVVSRVFGEAGFRSYDVKLAILGPPASVLRYPRSGGRCPPLFLCNFSVGADDFDVASRGFPFPLSAHSPSSDDTDENCRRITDAIKKGRNLLLVGAGGSEAARDLERAVATQKYASFPPELRGLQVFSMEKEVGEYVSGACNRPWIVSRFGDLALRLASRDHAASPGAVVCFGGLKGLVGAVENEGGSGLERVSYAVSELTRVLDGHRGRLWLMGSAATYETYMKFLSLCPSVDKDWGLQLLPITSVKRGSGAMLPAGLPSPSRLHGMEISAVYSRSLMESFGECLPTSPDSATPLSKQQNPSFSCQLCTDEYELELAALLKEFSSPVGLEHQVNLLPFQHQTGSISANSGLDIEKAKGDGTTLSAKIVHMQNKWNRICNSQHRSNHTEKNMSSMGSETFKHADGLHCDSDQDRSGNLAVGDGVALGPNLEDSIFTDLQKISSASQSTCVPVISEGMSKHLLSNLHSGPSKSEQFQISGTEGPSIIGMSNRSSLSSSSSVSTVLMLGAVCTSIGKTEMSEIHPCAELSHDAHGCISSTVGGVTERDYSAAQTQISSSVACSNSLGTKSVLTSQCPDITTHGASASDQPKLCFSCVSQPFGSQDQKTFYKSLVEKIGWQEDAIHAISECILRCKAHDRRLHGGRLRGDIWLCLLGLDRVGKRKISMALAEFLFGTTKNIISADLNSQGGVLNSNTICNKGINGYELSLRGMTVLDHIAGEICRKPCSVVFLENIDKADSLVRTSLSQAIKTGRFSDSHGREVIIKNTVFVITSQRFESKFDVSSKGNSHVKYPEERILAAQPWKMKVVVIPAPGLVQNGLGLEISGTQRRLQSEGLVAHKRKLSMADKEIEQHQSMGTIKRTDKTSNTCLDLNMTVEEMEASDAGNSNDEDDRSSGSMSTAWMEEFLKVVDGSAILQPFDFDALATDIMKEVIGSFQIAVDSRYLLEIEPKCMEQILAAAWLAEDKTAIHNWTQQVLVKSLVEIQELCDLPPRSVLRVVSCDGTPLEDYVPGIQLPRRISLC